MMTFVLSLSDISLVFRGEMVRPVKARQKLRKELRFINPGSGDPIKKKVPSKAINQVV